MAHKVRCLADVPSSENMSVLPQFGIHDCAEDTPIRDAGVAQVPLEDEHDASRMRTEKSTELFAPPAGLYGLRQIVGPLALSQPCATIGAVANVTEREGRDRMSYLAFGEDLEQSALPSVDRQRHGLWEKLNCTTRTNDTSTRTACAFIVRRLLLLRLLKVCV